MPAAITVMVPLPGYALQYLGVSAAQRLCFPNSDRFLEAHIRFTPAQISAIEKLSGQRELLRGQEVWRAMKGGQLQGFFIVDYVIGKHLVIDYAVALSAEGSVRQVEILNYRESYGGEIRDASWRKQFVGKTPRSQFALNDGIINISGATLSSRHVTEGIRRVLATYEVCLK
jgi:Na+-translocating ferredoxin:NAD+ oxidoreductase RnfG subunit